MTQKTYVIDPNGEIVEGTETENETEINGLLADLLARKYVLKAQGIRLKRKQMYTHAKYCFSFSGSKYTRVFILHPNRF